MSLPAEQIIVTGGTGFIGTSVCRLLATRGTPFTIVDRVVMGEFRERVLETDIREFEALRRNIYGDCLIHLAAVHRDDIRPLSLYDEVNVEGTRNVAASGNLAVVAVFG